MDNIIRRMNADLELRNALQKKLEHDRQKLLELILQIHESPNFGNMLGYDPPGNIGEKDLEYLIGYWTAMVYIIAS